MKQVFGPSSNAIVRGGLVVAGVLAVLAIAAAGVIVQRSAWVTSVGFVRPQPIPFSHAHHVTGLGIDCRYCHQTFEESSFAGMPTSDTCMRCHLEIHTTAAVLEPLRDSWRVGRPVAWNRVHDLPDFVYFNHAAHVHAGVGCTTCHGDVDEMALTFKAEPMSMSWCLDCHRDPHRTLAGALAWREKKQSDDLLTRVRTLLPREPRVSIEKEDVLTNCTACHR